METVRVTRPLTIDDAAVLAKLLHTNRDFMAPYEPVRGDDYYTTDRQRRVIEHLLERAGRGDCLPLMVVDDDAQPVGRITVNHIIRGALQSSSIGYWIAEQSNGRGLATRAVAEVKQIAFTELGLHRLEAGTLVDNIRSQRVLARNGFERYGLAPRYLKIAGDWQDHILFQVINES